MKFLLQIINGLQLGSIYALVALGYTMVYGIAKLINFAHGDILMVGSYVDAYFEGTLPTFSAQHPEIFSSRGKTAGELKSEYKQASIMIDRAVKDPVFMQYMAGDKQVIMTGEIEGVPVKIKIEPKICFKVRKFSFSH